jgi:hypothetical protein
MGADKKYGAAYGVSNLTVSQLEKESVAGRQYQRRERERENPSDIVTPKSPEVRRIAIRKRSASRLRTDVREMHVLVGTIRNPQIKPTVDHRCRRAN